MLNDASGFRRIYLATGYTDLRRGMEGLASIIKFNFQLDPYQKDILFLFCGRRTDRIKGLVWEGDGFLLLYKRLELGAFNWPRTKEEALEITPEQYQYLISPSCFYNAVSRLRKKACQIPDPIGRASTLDLTSHKQDVVQIAIEPETSPAELFQDERSSSMYLDNSHTIEIEAKGLTIRMSNTVQPMLLKILMDALKEPLC